MATGSQRGQARIPSVSHFSHAATGQAAPGPAGARGMTGTAQPLPPSGPGHPENTWEHTYPGTEDQLAHVRASLRPLLRDCPMADEALLIMSELAANAVRHSRSREDGGTFTARLLNVPGEYVLGEIEDGGSDWNGDLQGSARDASGLFLVLNLASACGVSGDSWKRVVWFRIRYPSGHRTPMTLSATIRPVPG
jgi:anti-sigma regulatory factor (Ser/Thr protein kinase)